MINNIRQIISDGFSNMQPEESCNNDDDNHDADEIENVHYTLRLSHARIRYEGAMLQQEMF